MQLAWDKTGQRFFEAGVDHGVLFPNGSTSGVAWSGLISIERTVSGGETESYYQDGIKYFDSVAGEDFQATLRAFTYPDEFGPCLGRRKMASGLTFTRQPRQTFGLAWRTKVGNDIDGIDHSSRIHLAYGLTAAPSAKSNATISDSPAASEFEWTLNAVPVLPGQGLGGSYGGDPNVDFLDWMWPPGFGMPGWPVGPDGNTPVPGWKATPYVVIEEKDVTPDVFVDLTDRIFGTPETLPYMPSQLDIVDLLAGNVIPNAPLDPNYVPPVIPTPPGSGVSHDPSLLNPLDIVYTETYKGALEDYPNDSIIPYGPANLCDMNDSTGIVMSTSWSADWFIYFDTKKLDPNSSQINLRIKFNSPVPTSWLGVRLSLADVQEPMAVKNLDYPDWYNQYDIGDFDFELKGGLTEATYVINQDWLNNNPTKLNWKNGSQWVNGPMQLHDLITLMKQSPLALLVAKLYYHPGTDVQMVKASIDHKQPSPYTYQGVTSYNLTNGDGDKQLEPPPWSPQPFYRKWVTLGNDFPRSLWEAADGFRIRLSAPASAGQKVEISCELDADRDYQSFYGVVTVQDEDNTFLYLDQNSLNYSSWGIPYSMDEAITRLSYVPPTFDQQSKCTIQVRPVSTNTKTVDISEFVLEAWKYQ